MLVLMMVKVKLSGLLDIEIGLLLKESYRCTIYLAQLTGLEPRERCLVLIA